MGERVRRRREQVGMSQEALAAKASVTRQYVSVIERDERTNPASQELFRLAKALNTTMEFLLTGDANLKLPDISNLSPELREIFYELVAESPEQFKTNPNLDEGDLRTIVEFVRFAKHRTKGLEKRF